MWCELQGQCICVLCIVCGKGRSDELIHDCGVLCLNVCVRLDVVVFIFTFSQQQIDTRHMTWTHLPSGLLVVHSPPTVEYPVAHLSLTYAPEAAKE